MSLILDALKRSEGERQEQEGAIITTQSYIEPVPEPKKPFAKILIGSLVAINFSLLIFFLGIKPQLDSNRLDIASPAPSTQDKHIGYNQANTKHASTRPLLTEALPVENEQKHQDNDLDSNKQELIEIPPRKSPPEVQKKAEHQLEADSSVDTLPEIDTEIATLSDIDASPDPDTSEGSFTTTVKPAINETITTDPTEKIYELEPQTAQTTQTAQVIKPQMVHAPEVIQPQTIQALPLAKTTPTIPTTATTIPVAPTTTQSQEPPLPSNLLRLQDLPDNIRSQLTAYDINAHVFSDIPEKRFVLINMKRFREGETLNNSRYRIDRIMPNGLIIDYSQGKALIPLIRP